MTYQYLTVDMICTAKEKGGFIDQKTFKTAGKYGFDSLILSDPNMQALNGYILYIRPLLKPQCDFFHVNRNDGQHGKLIIIIMFINRAAMGRAWFLLCTGFIFIFFFLVFVSRGPNSTRPNFESRNL